MDKDKDVLKHIQGAIDGKQASFNFLLDTFWAGVYGFLLKKSNNENDAEDIAIQAFSKAFDKIETYNPDYKFNTWITTIAKNTLYDTIRKRKSSILIKTSLEQKEEAYNIIDDAPTPEDKLITEQNLAQLLKDIKKLKPKYQEVIQLRFFQELSYKEIASLTKEPINNIKVKLLRAKKLLAEIIKDK